MDFAKAKPFFPGIYFVCREKVVFAKAKSTFFPGSILNPAARGV
jgi:hypothetical protein